MFLAPFYELPVHTYRHTYVSVWIRFLDKVAYWVKSTQPSSKWIKMWKGDQDWSINPIILDIKALIVLFRFVDFDHIPRTLDVQAHMLANFYYSAG